MECGPGVISPGLLIANFHSWSSTNRPPHLPPLSSTTTRYVLPSCDGVLLPRSSPSPQPTARIAARKRNAARAIGRLTDGAQAAAPDMNNHKWNSTKGAGRRQLQGLLGGRL